MEFLQPKGQQHWQRVNYNTIASLWQLYHTEPTIQSCAHVIFNRLLTLGLLFETETKVVDEKFQKHARVYFEKFAREFVSSMWVQGLVAYHIIKERKGKNEYPIPHILHHDTIFIEFKFNNDYEREYRVISKMTGDEIPETFVHESGPPTKTGGVISIISNIHRLCSFKNMLELSAVVAEEVRAKPPVLTRVRTDKAFDERDMHGSGIVPGMVGQIEFENMTTRNNITTIAMQQQRNLVRILNQAGIDSSSNAWRERVDPMTGLPVFSSGMEEEDVVPPFIPLPNYTEALPYTLPQVRNDLVSLQRYTREMICSVMGVPPQSLEGRYQTVAALTLNDDLMTNTVGSIENILKIVFKNLLSLIFPTENVWDGMNIVFPGLRRQNALERLWKEGVLSKTAYANFLMDTYDLKEEDIDLHNFNMGININNKRQKNDGFSR